MATTVRDGQQEAPADKGRAKGSFLRRALVPLLVVLACLTFTAAVTGVWARRNFLDTERFADRSAEIIEDEAVQEALTLRITDALMQLIDPQALFTEVLPERGQLLAVPLSGAVEGFVEDQVEAFLASDLFQRLWVGVSTIAHETAVHVLRGEGDVLATADGQVTINLLPIVNAVLAELTSASPEILGREIDVEEIPEDSIARLEELLGVDLGEDYGQLTVYDDDTLAAAQQGVSVFDQIVVVLLPVSVVLGALALWLSRRRRRTLLQLCVGVTLGCVLLRRVSFRMEDEVTTLAPTEEGGRAASAVIEVFLTPLTTFSAWVIITAAVVALIALVTGPYAWAESLRGATSRRAGDEDTSTFVRDHRDVLLAVGALAVLALLWTADLSWLGLLVVLALLAVYAAAVHRIGSSPADAP